MTTEYTPNFRFNLPDFRMGPWHDLVNGNTTRIDQILLAIYQGVDTAPWENNTLYTPGMTAIDLTDNSFWVCAFEHTSAPAPTTFAEDRIAHPTFWIRTVVGITPRGQWLNDTHYLVNDMVSDAEQAVVAICITEHDSITAPGTIRDDELFWTFIVDMNGGLATQADQIGYDNSTSGATGDNLQETTDDLYAKHEAQESDIATIGAAAIDHEGRIDTLETSDAAQTAAIATNSSEITNLDTRTTTLEGTVAGHETRVTNLETASATHLTDAPSDGQQYARKDGAWDVVAAASGGAAVLVSDTPPVGATANSLWWESDTGQLYILYNDGDTTQWVAAVNIPDFSTFATVAYVDAQNAAQNALAAPKKNYIINSGHQIAQETTGPVTASNSYPADQFWASHGNAATQTWQVVGVPTPGGSPNRLRLTATVADAAVAASDYSVLIHRIEGTRVADLKYGTANAKTMTLRFGCKGPAGTYCVNFRNPNPDRCYVAEYVISAGEANTDVVKTITIPGDVTGTWPTNTLLGYQITWVFMAGTTYHQTANSWQALGLLATANQLNFLGTGGNVFELFDIGFYEGSVAPPWVLPKYDEELAACQRYWQKITWGIEGVATGANQRFGNAFTFVTEMRTGPTRIRSSIGGVLNIRAGDTNTYVTANALDSKSAFASLEVSAAGFAYATNVVETYSARM